MLTFNLWVHVLIFLYSNEYRTISLSDVSRDLGIPFSTASKLCTILVKTRLIRIEKVNGRKNKIIFTENGKSLAMSLYNSKAIISKL